MSLQIVKVFASLLSMLLLLLLLERWPVPPPVSPDNGDNLKQTPKQHTTHMHTHTLRQSNAQIAVQIAPWGVNR